MTIAHIALEECVGCTKCIQACPVDCIIGSEGLLHQVIPHECIGCGLCLPACPVDCITLDTETTVTIDKKKAKMRHDAKKKRLEEKNQHYKTLHTQLAPTAEAQKAYILAALQRKLR